LAKSIFLSTIYSITIKQKRKATLKTAFSKSLNWAVDQIFFE